MRQLVLGIGISVVFAAGCIAGAASSGSSSSYWAVPKARAAEAETQRFAYLCVDAASAEDLHEKANQAGARGWQMVSGATRPGSAGGMVWCFRQPRP